MELFFSFLKEKSVFSGKNIFSIMREIDDKKTKKEEKDKTPKTPKTPEDKPETLIEKPKDSFLGFCKATSQKFQQENNDKVEVKENNDDSDNEKKKSVCFLDKDVHETICEGRNMKKYRQVGKEKRLELQEQGKLESVSSSDHKITKPTKMKLSKEEKKAKKEKKEQKKQERREKKEKKEQKKKEKKEKKEKKDEMEE